MALPASLNQKIEDFLATRSKSDGGFAPVGEKDIELLGGILHGLIKAKYQKDPDGDLPVSFQLVDRTRYQGSYFSPVPHLPHGHDECVDMEALLRVLRISNGNLATAQDQVNRAMRAIEFGAVENMNKGMPVSFGERSYEVALPGDDRSVAVNAAKDHTVAYLNEYPPVGMDDFSTRQAWETAANEAISERLGAAVGVQVRPSRKHEDKLLVVVSMLFMRDDQPNSKVMLQIDDPTAAFHANKEGQALNAATTAAAARQPKKRL